MYTISNIHIVYVCDKPSGLFDKVDNTFTWKLGGIIFQKCDTINLLRFPYRNEVNPSALLTTSLGWFPSTIHCSSLLYFFSLENQTIGSKNTLEWITHILWFEILLDEINSFLQFKGTTRESFYKCIYTAIIKHSA